VNAQEKEQAAIELRGLGGHARRLLEECVEHQGITRSKPSKSAEALFDAGFVYIREIGDIIEPNKVEINPALWGEEALEALEEMEEKRKKK